MARRPKREGLLARATHASQFPEPQRRWTVLSLIHERYRTPLKELGALAGDLGCTEAELFLAAYGDPEGRYYWAGWLDQPWPVQTLAQVLATHLATSEPLFAARQADLLAALGTNLYAPAGPPVCPRTVVEGWVQRIDTRKLVPDSLAHYLSAANVAPGRDKSKKRLALWEQIAARMQQDIAGGKITKAALNALPDKELIHRYGGDQRQRTTFVKALKSLSD